MSSIVEIVEREIVRNKWAPWLQDEVRASLLAVAKAVVEEIDKGIAAHKTTHYVQGFGAGGDQDPWNAALSLAQKVGRALVSEGSDGE